LNFFPDVNKIIDHIFLGVPVGRSFGVQFAENHIQFLESVIILRSFEHSWQADDDVRREKHLKLDRDVDKVRSSKKAASLNFT
jgi:hypothetical protein